MDMYRKKNGKFVSKPAYNRATSMVRAKKDKRDQENAEDATANSKNRSQQPIGICDHPCATTAAASLPFPTALDVHREEVCITEVEQNFDPNSVNYAGETDWKEGCVVVDLGVLFTSLQCDQCSLPLDPSKCMGIHRVGVCGWVYIICTNQACNLMNKVPLGKTHKCAVKGPDSFDVNTKVALGKFISMLPTFSNRVHLLLSHHTCRLTSHHFSKCLVVISPDD